MSNNEAQPKTSKDKALCALCDEGNPVYRRDACRSCYENNYAKRIICESCGEEKPHMAIGLCKQCYFTIYNEIRSNKPCVICEKKGRVIKDFGMCHSCYELVYGGDLIECTKCRRKECVEVGQTMCHKCLMKEEKLANFRRKKHAYAIEAYREFLKTCKPCQVCGERMSSARTDVCAKCRQYIKKRKTCYWCKRTDSIDRVYGLCYDCRTVWTARGKPIIKEVEDIIVSKRRDDILCKSCGDKKISKRGNKKVGFCALCAKAWVKEGCPNPKTFKRRKVGNKYKIITH